MEHLTPIPASAKLSIVDKKGAKMTEYRTEWTGSYPCLCSGEWTLFIDGVPSDVEIPFQGEPADTFGDYHYWWFEGDWEEHWGSEESGMPYAEWRDKYYDYLMEVAPKEDWKDIYWAFNANDWRHSSCGGCI